MSKKKFLIGITIFIWIILILDLIASYYFLYWRFWWADIVMHFFGGAWLTLLGYYIFYLSDFKEKLLTWKPGFQVNFLEKYSVLTISLLFVLTISLLWEGFELIFAFPLKVGYSGDTVLDLVMDIIGWGIVYFVVLKNQKIQSLID